jgi:folate-binding protein YgfZ
MIARPDFLWRLLALAKFMRLSLMKAAHAVISSAAYRKSGSPLRCAALALLQGYNFIVLSAMSQSHPRPVTDSMTAPGAVHEGGPIPVSTLLFAALQAQEASLEPAVHCGALTPRVFDGLPGEMDSLLYSAGVSDLGWRGKILVTGSDRLRWLNGMVSNTVQSLPEEEGNYSFLLSVQGRIQGDCYVYRRSGDLLLDTGFDQVAALMRHLDHFIIMDDVELADVSHQWTALSLAGPAAPRVLATLGFAPSPSNVENARMHSARVGEVPCTIVEARHVAVPRFELWFAPEHVLALWETLQAAGATPCGLEALEALRVLEATPLYGIDLNDRDLPQETAQTRALNFSKGCYLGQEIVERIRSRGKVNRQFRQFSLRGAQPAEFPIELRSGEQSVGRITSTASLPGAGLLGLGFIRVEIVERNAEITYDAGVATALAAPPEVTRTSPS